jgi:beta-lactamase class A
MRLSVIAICAAVLGVGAGLSGCGGSTLKTNSDTPQIDGKRLDGEVAAIADRARPAVLGIALMNLESGQFWTFNGDRPFPLGSASAAPIAGAALAEVDAGRLSLDQTIPITDEDLSPPPSAIADAWPGRTDYTVRELLVAAVTQSDNTAADVLMRRIGGPGAVTAWLKLKNIELVRVDRYARETQTDLAGMASFRAGWKGDAAFDAARATVSPNARRAATQAYLRDVRDTATPRSFLHFLMELDDRALISPPSTALLLQTMTGQGPGANRLKAGLPPGAAFAHEAGAARGELGVTPAVNDVGLITLPDKRRYAVVVFLAGSPLDEARRDAVIADVGRAVIRGVR